MGKYDGKAKGPPDDGSGSKDGGKGQPDDGSKGASDPGSKDGGNRWVQGCSSSRVQGRRQGQSP